MKKLFIFLILFSAILLYCDETNCFSIIVGSKATEDGSVLLAHNEDDKGKNFFVNVHRISPLNHSSPTVIKLKNNATISQINQTFGFLWLQIPDIEFADSYINENGVVIVSNACESREDKPDLTNGGIGFMLRRIVAERATSARHAIEIAGSLIERFGYYSSGRTLCIADSTEGWILHIVKGKHWIARRVPDNEVAVVSNYYTIRNFTMKNRKDFLGSPDIVYYATKRGWYDPRKDGDFDFAKVYSDLKNFKSMVNILRQWRGSNLLSEDKYKIDSRFPFSFKPKKKIKIGNLFRVLRDHYEGTEYDLTDNYKKGGSPNSTKNKGCVRFLRQRLCTIRA